MWRWLKKLFVRDNELLEKLACLDIKITNLGKLNGSMAAVIALLQRMEKDNQMALQQLEAMLDERLEVKSVDGTQPVSSRKRP